MCENWSISFRNICAKFQYSTSLCGDVIILQLFRSGFGRGGAVTTVTTDAIIPMLPAALFLTFAQSHSHTHTHKRTQHQSEGRREMFSYQLNHPPIHFKIIYLSFFLVATAAAARKQKNYHILDTNHWMFVFCLFHISQSR